MNQLLIILGILFIPLCASIYCSSTYKKFVRKNTKSAISGFEVARKILDKKGLKDIHIVETSGTMSDHYDPSRKVVRLSKEVFHGTTVASVAIAAHECGHAIQDKDKYLFMKIRAFIFPVVNISSYIAYILIIISFVLSSIGLFYLSILLMSMGVLFQLVTLPVEFNASRRAEVQLKELNTLEERELDGTKSMLTSAALTYVAGLVSSLLEILRLILIFRGND